jgi:prefoldin beta subunit
MNNVDKETKNKIPKLQILEQRLNSLLLQKQTFQTQLLEIENALGEIESSSETYKIVGNIMISMEKDELKDELSSKKGLFDVKLNSIEKEETKLREEANELQKEVLSAIGK